MDKLRSREFTRVVGSFFLAVGFHALFFLFTANGMMWGSNGNDLDYILVHPRLIEIDSPRADLTAKQSKTASEKQQPSSKIAAPEKLPAKEEVKAKMEEVHQEKQAIRETKPEQGEVIEKRVGEVSQPDGELEDNEEEASASAAPSLPPLGGAGGMIIFTPRFSYPKGAEHRGVEGKVQLELQLTSEGTLLKEPLITVSSGHPELDEHCVKMFKAKEWKFKPASQPYQLMVEVHYSNNAVESKFIGEAAYLSAEEGGDEVEKEK